MGRAMLIICSAVIISLGIVGLSTSRQGKMLTEQSSKYANEMTAKNAAHTAIQIAMQNINKDSLWIETHDSPGEAWVDYIDGAKIELYLEALNDPSGNGYWEDDSIRMVSKANIFNNFKATITSLYLKSPFSSLVPEFTGALQLPNGYGNLNVSGNAHGINGTDTDCGVTKPPITVESQATKDAVDAEDINMDGEVEVDTTLNYQPTDELVRRLVNSGNATTVSNDYSGTLGTPTNPGVFVIDGDVKLTGNQKKGYGIMIVRNKAFMEYEGEDGNTLSIKGNFDFHGLVIFENANAFDGGGTPGIYGSVLVGDTEGPTDIEITLHGNININYSCEGENYAKMSAANTVKQNKYTRVVTFEEVGF